MVCLFILPLITFPGTNISTIQLFIECTIPYQVKFFIHPSVDEDFSCSQALTFKMSNGCEHF